MDIKRIPYIDIVAGIMILWMIFQHAMQSAWAIGSPSPGEMYAWNPNVWFPYLNFFMPWFFYKSGAFFRKRNIKDLMVKDNHKLTLTFLIWSLIGYVFYLILGVYAQTLTLREALYTLTRRFFFNGFIAINSPLWFLLTLIGVRFIANICLPNQSDPYKHYKCAAIVLSGAMIGFGCYIYDNPLVPLWVANGASGIAFFTFGYWLHCYENQKWFVIPCILGYVCSCVFGWNSVCMHINELLEGLYLLWFTSALCGIVCFNVVCRHIYEWMTKITPPHYSRTRILETIGKNAMPIYVTHSFVRFPIQTILETSNVSLSWQCVLVIICIGYALVLPIVCVLWNKFGKIKTK